MTSRVLPDVEQLVVDYLKGLEAVRDIHASVETDPQKTKNARFPQVLITRLGGPSDYPSWLEHARIQVDVRAQTKQDAFRATAIVRAAMEDLPQAEFDNAVVTGVDDELGPQPIPDRSVDPPRPRYVFSKIVHVHPRLSSS